MGIVRILAVIGLGILAAVAASAAATGGRSVQWVEQRVRQWQPTERERRLERIGWAKDLREALRQAKRHGRPVFLFTLDGRMALGRC